MGGKGCWGEARFQLYKIISYIYSPPSSPLFPIFYPSHPLAVSFCCTFVSHSAHPSKLPSRPFNKHRKFSTKPHPITLLCRTLTSEQTKISVGVIFNHKNSPVKTLTPHIPRKKITLSLKPKKLPHINVIKS